MRVVIDTNSLETDELRLFLSASKKNFAVLPEHLAAEMFRPKSLDAIYSNFAVLCETAGQVLQLWSNQKALLVNPRRSAMANHFIDRQSSRTFGKFCDVLAMAQDGHAGLQRQLNQRQTWAQERVDAVEGAFGDMSEALEELRSNFTRQELRTMASGEPFPDGARGRIYALTLALAEDQLAKHTNGWRLPSPPHRYNHFAWRYSLCHLVQMIEMMNRGARRRSPAKARNDHFDNVVATFGTYFNGVMTNDRKVLFTQHFARMVLKSLGVRLAPDYNETQYILDVIEMGGLEAGGRTRTGDFSASNGTL